MRDSTECETTNLNRSVRTTCEMIMKIAQLRPHEELGGLIVLVSKAVLGDCVYLYRVVSCKYFYDGVFIRKPLNLQKQLIYGHKSVEGCVVRLSISE